MFRTALINKSLRTRQRAGNAGSPPRCWSCWRWSAAVRTPATTIRRAASAASTESQGQVWLYDADSRRVGRGRSATGRSPPATASPPTATRAPSSASARPRCGSPAAASSRSPPRRRAHRLFLLNGSAALRVRSQDVAREFELATAEGRFTPRAHGPLPLRPPRQTSDATVWNGECSFEYDDSALTSTAGRSAEFWREADATHYTLVRSRSTTSSPTGSRAPTAKTTAAGASRATSRRR